MKRMVRKGVILTVGSCLIAMLIAGCEEQNLSTVRRDKLIAYENKQLKEQLAQQEKEFEEQMAQREKEIEEQLAQREKKIKEQNRLLEECQQRRETLKKRFEEKQPTQREKKIEEQNRLLEECQQRREVLEKRFEEEVNAGISEVVDIFGQADKELLQENNQLKAQVSELEQELKRLKPPAEPQPLTP